MNTVKSKYKNPDKYIQRLKNVLDRVREQSSDGYDLYEKAIGRQIVSWSKGVTDSQAVNGHKFGVLRPGDIIHRVGRITRVIIEKGSSTIEFDQLGVRKI